ncbi:MAG TPA: DUF4188 domain-containing protein [Polyangiaceae bacterium]|jgi:hypothetical protein|nr:DUF4188 domain-containing protein [Polyangiaceae bacterium]
MKTHNERVTHNACSEPVVVFLIGMRVNRWWKVHQWLRTALAMPRMLRELGAHPELGLLGGESWFGRTTILVSYWKSVDHLFAYAKMRNADHLPAWRAFNKHIGTNGDVGIWHETYVVQPGASESVYVNMPDFGLGKVMGLRSASHRPDLTKRAAAA